MGRSQGGGQRRLGDFVLIEEIGRGGMGVVYRARQESLGRIVAVKILPSFAGLDPGAVARFRREAESAARISHRGIVPIYAVGEDQGTYFYAMELVDGPSLEAMLGELAGRNPSRLLGALAEETSLGERCPGFGQQRHGGPSGARFPVSCAAIAAELASALVVAHHGHIIHRDLKPSNVLLRKDGRPMIVDFGLARDQTAVGLTQSGDAVGTPSYMAPEQAYGAKDLDARVDVYGLGATLYEMLTLRPPFDGESAVEVMRQILEDEPPSVRSLNARVPVALATIVHKCLVKDRDGRYPVMEAVEHDLRAFLQGGPIAAQAPSLWARGASAAARHRRGIAVVAATACVMALAGVAAGVWNGTRARDEGIEVLQTAGADLIERANIDLAQENYGRATQLLGDPALVAAARMQHIGAAFERHYGSAERREWLARALDTVPAEARDAAWSALQRRLRGEAKCALVGHMLDAESSVTLHRFGAHCFEEIAGGWPPDGVLGVGHYLVRVERIGLAPAAVAFTVERDTPRQIFVPQLNVGSLAEGEVMVACAAQPERAFALSRTELASQDCTRLLASLSPAQRAEFEGVEIGGDGEPVRNLSFRQARTLAALSGGHLPSAAEFVLAARASVSAAAMPYPWGATFTAERVCADPARLLRPDPVDTRPDGASPFGLLHLAGNVAEMLSAGADVVPRVAGGDWLSPPAGVRSDASERARDLDQPFRRGGVRVARFLFPSRADGADSAAASNARFDEQWRAGAATVLSEWDIDDSGAASTRLRVSGFLAAGQSELRIPLSTPGFLQDGPLVCRLGDSDAATKRTHAGDGETSFLTIATAGLAARQLFRVEVRCPLTPVSGLVGQADSYVLQIPLKATGNLPTSYRVTLPRGSRVDDVDPPPTSHLRDGERPVLVWEFGADAGGVRTFAGVVRLRKDGFLSRRWPTKAEAMAVVRRFTDAVNQRDAAALRGLLAPTFLLAPGNLDVARLTDSDRPAHELFDNVRFVDATAVGPVVTTELLVDWRVVDRAGTRVAVDWPLRVHWRRDGERATILQVAPASRGDTGRIENGVYLHDQLLVRVEPADFTIARTVGRLASMQVELRPAEAAPHFVMVLGTYDEADSEPDAMWQRLSDGVQIADVASRALAAADAACGKHVARREDWLLAAGAGFTCERWFKVRTGRRWILLRAVAVGQTAAAATSQWNSAKAWFERTLARVQIE